MLHTHDLRAWYGRTQALFGVDLSLNQGEVLALVGTNGAGKSTIIRALLGLVRTQGEVTIDGTSISDWPTYRRIRRCGVAVLHEERCLFGELTVTENMLLGLPKSARKRLDDVAPAFPIVAERSQSLVSALSGGQRQLVAIARMVLAEPRYVLLDEPTLGLSPAMVDEVYDHLGVLTEMGIGVLLVEQNINRARAIADRLQLVTAGQTAPPVDAKDMEAVTRLEMQAFGAGEVESGFTELTGPGFHGPNKEAQS